MMEEKWFLNPILTPVTKTRAAGQHCGCKFILKCSLITFHLSPSKFISQASWSMRGQKKGEEESLCVLWFGLNPVVLPTEFGPARHAATWWGFSPALSLALCEHPPPGQDVLLGGQTELIFNFILHVYHHGRMSPFFVGLTDQPETSAMCLEHGWPRMKFGIVGCLLVRFGEMFSKHYVLLFDHLPENSKCYFMLNQLSG